VSRRTRQREALISPKYMSRRRREARLTRWIVIGTYVALGIAVVLLGVGLVDRYVLQPRRPVATVAGVPIRLSQYQDAYRYRYWTLQRTIAILESQRFQYATNEELASVVSQIDEQLAQLSYELSSLPTVVVEELIDSELARQEAERRGLSVSEEEVQEEIERRFGFDRAALAMADPVADAGQDEAPAADEAAEQVPTLAETSADEPEAAATPTETVTPSPTAEPMSEEEFRGLYADYVAAMQQQTGVGEAVFRDLVRAELLQRKVEDAIAEDVPTTTEHIRARRILVNTEDEAQAALERIQGGEDFADVAAEVSTDTYTKDDGGDLGWFPRGIRGEAFDAVAFSLQPGELSGVVQTASGYEIIQVLERDPERELEPLDRQHLQYLAVRDWFAERRMSPDVVWHWNSSMTPSLGS